MDPILGQIELFAFGFAPVGWLPCNGQTLNVSQYQAVFSLIGYTYGGNGSTTFALPNLNGASGQPSAALSPANANTFLLYYMAVQGIYPERP